MVSNEARAGRPLSTEDAGILEAHRCQLESWLDRSRDATTGWVVPACNVAGGIEWQIGVARTHEAGASRFSEAYFQAKTVFIEPGEEGTGVGLVVGLARRPLNETHRGWENPYAVIPFTRSIGPALLHLNLGWARDRGMRRDTTTWGLAAEWPVDRWTAVAEAFGENSGRPWLRGGFRWTAIPDALDIDLTWVGRPGGERAERYFSLGFTFVTPSLAR